MALEVAQFLEVECTWSTIIVWFGSIHSNSIRLISLLPDADEIENEITARREKEKRRKLLPRKQDHGDREWVSPPRKVKVKCLESKANCQSVSKSVKEGGPARLKCLGNPRAAIRVQPPGIGWSGIKIRNAVTVPQIAPVHFHAPVPKPRQWATRLTGPRLHLSEEKAFCRSSIWAQALGD